MERTLNEVCQVGHLGNLKVILTVGCLLLSFHGAILVWSNEGIGPQSLDWPLTERGVLDASKPLYEGVAVGRVVLDGPEWVRESLCKCDVEEGSSLLGLLQHWIKVWEAMSEKIVLASLGAIIILQYLHPVPGSLVIWRQEKNMGRRYLLGPRPRIRLSLSGSIGW